jgi:hypothetical protein
MVNLFTVTISTTTAENGYSYNHFKGEARNRSPKVALRLAKEALGRDFNRDPYGAACGAIYDRMVIRKGAKVILDQEVW